ncbi:MAG: phosphatase [Bacteroidetes bacterium CG02_land_8_20_14_3_00_31_25]|nr:phosphatase [Bacteroidota bacterium]PIV61929.1 MAG: phosphatase [Bacteroidetes bacterium CG02_land_8_20_14_3_00_31_25]
MRIAAIDLGTNTFNLLVADADAQSYTEVLRDKRVVKLGLGGITNNTISEEAIQRGVSAIKDYIEIMAPLSVDKTLAVATSAIRSTNNGLEFTKLLKNKFNLDVRIIGGDEEAELIYYGIRRAINIQTENVLMLDIGGGSNEFIIGNGNRISWKHSFTLGIARLLETFEPSNPLTNNEIENVILYFEKELKPLFEAINIYPVKKLVGSSGSFDTIANICSLMKCNKALNNEKTFFEFKKNELNELCNKIIISTTNERIAMPGMDLMRVEMLPLAALFIKFIIAQTNVTEITQSAYSIKEGIILSYSETEN